MNTQTTATFNYVPDQAPETTEPVLALGQASAVEPILKRWRHKCTPGLIDASGKIRHIYTRAESGAADSVGRVIDELNAIPEALAELDAALEARRRLNALTQNSVVKSVRNARTLSAASLHTNGFELHPHHSAVTDWHDDRAIASTYYEEMNALVKSVTGAVYTFSNNHLRRESEPEVGGNGPLAKLMSQSRGALQAAHNDFTETYGEGIIRTIASGGTPHTQTFGLTQPMLDAGLTEADLRGHRMLVINTWRPVIDKPLKRFPLALADRRTIPHECLQSSLIGRVPTGQPRGGLETYSAKHDPRHEWYYYPDMTRDEVLLWKGFDSAEVPARPTLHSAFDDPDTPADAPQRVSVEVRVLCLLPLATR